MTVDQLRKACSDARAQGLEHLILVVPRKREPGGMRPRVRVLPGVTGTLVGSQNSKTRPGCVDLIVDVEIAAVERAIAKYA